jgi:tripartite ATP-independent transporter DctM subunit
MANEWIAIYCFIGMFILLGMGVPIFMALLVPSIIGMWFVGSAAFTLTQGTLAPFNISASYTFAVVPMFLLMGILAAESGMAEKAYNSISKWTTKIRGGLLIATVVANAVFGAVSGVTLASNAVFTKIALPELDKNDYNRKFSMGCIASASVVSVLIPPSIPIIVFAILTDISIGRALIAGIIPAIITVIVVCGIIYVTSYINPKIVPYKPINVSWRERFSSIKLLGPIALIFILMMGGMMLGFFPSTVGGAIGAFGVLMYAIFVRIGWGKIRGAFHETVLLNASILIILIAGFMFGRLVALSHLSEALIAWITNAQLPPFVVLSLIIIVYILLGAALEEITILIITLPIVFPLLLSLGFDPYAFCIANVLLGQIAGLSPPVGISIFIVAAAADAKASDVYLGSMPFFIAEIILVWVFMFVPQLSTWLPNLLFKAAA